MVDVERDARGASSSSSMDRVTLQETHDRILTDTRAINDLNGRLNAIFFQSAAAGLRLGQDHSEIDKIREDAAESLRELSAIFENRADEVRSKTRDLEFKRDELAQDAGRLDDEMDLLRAELEKLNQEYALVEQEEERAIDYLNSDLSPQIALTHRKDNLAAELAMVEEQISATNDQLDDLGAQKQGMDNEIMEIEDFLRNLDERIREERYKLGSEIQKLKEIIDSHQISQESAEARLRQEFGEELLRMVEELQATYKMMKDTATIEVRAEYEPQIENLKKELKELQLELAGFEVKIETLQEEEQLLITRTAEASRTNELLSTRVTELRAFLSVSRRHPSSIISKLQQKLEQMRSKYEILCKDFQAMYDANVALTAEIKHYDELLLEAIDVVDRSKRRKTGRSSEVRGSLRRDEVAFDVQRYQIFDFAQESDFVTRIDVINKSRVNRSLSGWRLEIANTDESFVFPENSIIPAGGVVTVWLGAQNNQVDVEGNFLWATYPSESMGLKIYILTPSGEIENEIVVGEGTAGRKNCVIQ